MKVRFFKKRVTARNFPIGMPVITDNTSKEESVKPTDTNTVEEKEDSTEKKTQKAKNKTNKKQETMTENEKLEMAQELVQELKPETKVIKKDKGLIERTESSKIILTEDNKQILND